ncbi:MAG TPA: hypothetical protein VJI13_02575 [Candidatus Norongarragalinales archaeon]|nr:hypothetical protein [Candidatus Norongarragalinales archaeon]
MGTLRRAQSGLEYLVTYGWAIFILVLVIAILWQTGIFNSIDFAGPINPSSGFSSFKYVDHYVNTTGAVIVLNNAVTRRVQVTGAEIGEVDSDPDTDCSPASPLNIGANGNFTLTCPSIPQGALSLVGDNYEVKVEIDFIDQVSGNPHTDIGFVRGKVMP